MEQLYAPVAADLSAALGRPVRLRTRPSFALFRHELVQERYDLVFIQPFTYANIASRHDYRAVARPSTALRAVVVVRSDDTIDSIDDLKGKTISAPPRQAAVSLLARDLLYRHNLVPGRDVRLVYRNNHAACLRAILIRKAVACVTAPPPLKIFKAKTGVTFKVIGYSLSIPGTPYAVHRRLPDQQRETIARRITTWQHSARGRALLKAIGYPSFINSDDSDYQPVRDLLLRVGDD